jgi:hypothetical protein
MVLVLATALIASGCGGGSSDGDSAVKPSIAAEPKPTSTNLHQCLTDEGLEVQREGTDLVRVTPNGRAFTEIREFGSEGEAVAYDAQVTVATHIRVGAKVAYGGTASNLKVVEECLRAEAP